MTYCYCPSHPHKEDDVVADIIGSNVLISTHILTRRMTGTAKRISGTDTFQLTSSQGGWQEQNPIHSVLPDYFNSHPHKEDDKTIFIHAYMVLDFNSHPHKEDDNDGRKKRGTWKGISTHILTRRMTASERPWTRTWWTFQLTSSRGGWRRWKRPENS